MSEKTAFQTAIARYAWTTVPIISLLGILISVLFTGHPQLKYAGIAGCVIASFALALIAYFKPRKDIVSLIAPLYAVIIFNPWSEFTKGFTMQLLYAITIILITWRLERRFSE